MVSNGCENFKGDILCFKTGTEKVFVLRNDIVMFATKERKVEIYTSTATFIVKATLNEIEVKLDDASFFRSHQSYLINLKKVKKIINKGTRRYVVFHGIKKTAIISKANEQKLEAIIQSI